MQTIIHFFSDKHQSKSALVLAQVLKKFLSAAKANGFEAQMIHKILGQENNSVLDAFVAVPSQANASFLKNWIGTIRWIGKSDSKLSASIKITKETNWFVGSRIWSKLQADSFNPNDVEYQAMRSSGAGGQHVNKVSTAVRAIHVPTCIQVSASDSRSQHKNKALALERLEQKVIEHFAQTLLETLKKENNLPSILNTSKVVKTLRGTDFKKESQKKPIKKERQRSKIDLKRLHNDND
jgi:peptide chain release factor